MNQNIISINRVIFIAIHLAAVAQEYLVLRRKMEGFKMRHTRDVHLRNRKMYSYYENLVHPNRGHATDCIQRVLSGIFSMANQTVMG